MDGYSCDFEQDRLPFDDNTFDGIVCLEVIEHVWSTDNILGEAERVLKPDGWLLLTTPNYLFWRYRIKYLRGKWKLLFPPDTLHKRAYSVDTICAVLERYFRIEKVSGIGSFPLVGSFLTRFRLNLSAENVVVRCRKRK